MSLRSFASWKNLLVIGCVVFFATVGITQFATPTYAAGLNEDCSEDSECNTGDTCATAGACVCRLSSIGLGRCGVTIATDAASTAEERAARVEESIASSADSCGPPGAFGTYICQGITMVLGWIVTLLGWIVSLLLTVLLAFAKYNSFASAAPVTVGWPIVRDICNMFFIVILLISAFATIIDQGQGGLHYTKVLPRLLVMAVLINFSKTLIQLLIDFSQVVMLTFVNAFASAAQGNFVNALGLTDIMRLSADAGPGTANGTNIIIAYMLAIFMLGITISVVTIMTAFLIFRIVGLWIALILSPLAFFVTAIPPQLSKHFGSLGGEYWTRLGSLLTGGPIIAFFLWLTLAVVQGANSGGGGLASALSFDVPEGAATFITSIGDAQSIASFIVGITLLMMGLDQAVKSAGAIGGTIGASFAARARGAGMSIGRLGALAPFLAAGYGARGGARALDRRFDLTRKVSTAGLQTLGRVPVLKSALRPTLAKGLTMRREEAAKEAAEDAALMAGVGKVGSDQELKMLGKTYSMRDSAFRTLGSRAGSAKVAEILSTDDLRDREAKRNKTAFIDDLKKKNPGMSDDEAKAGSDVLSKEAANREQGKYVRSQLALAKKAEDTGKVESLEKYMKANPHLADPAAPYLDKDGNPVEGKNSRDKYIEDLATDPDLYKDVGKLDAMSGELATGFMLKHGWEESDKEITDASGNKKTVKVLEEKDKAAWDRVKSQVKLSKNDTLLKGLEAQEELYKRSGNTDYRDLKNVQHRIDPKDNILKSYRVDSALPGDGGVRVRNSEQLQTLAALEKRDSSAAAGSTYTQSSADVGAALLSGASLQDVMDRSKKANDIQKTIRLTVSSSSLDAANAGDDEQAFQAGMSKLTSVLKHTNASSTNDTTQLSIYEGIAPSLETLLESKNFSRTKDSHRKVMLEAVSVFRDRVQDLKGKASTSTDPDEIAKYNKLQQVMSRLEERATRKESGLGSGVSAVLRKDSPRIEN